MKFSIFNFAYSAEAASAAKAGQFSKRGGFTLTEVVVYVALLGVVLVFVVNFWIRITDTYTRSRAEREVLSNARLVLGTFQTYAAQAREIYRPTTRANQSMSQLSLVLPIEDNPQHQTAFVDFWVDNGRLWLREEGKAALPITAAAVRVERFWVEEISQALDRQSMRLVLDVVSIRAKDPTTLTLHTSVALRGNY